jgi:hypothetical protein
MIDSVAPVSSVVFIPVPAIRSGAWIDVGAHLINVQYSFQVVVAGQLILTSIEALLHTKAGKVVDTHNLKFATTL